MYIYPSDAKRYLREARQSLEKMKEAKDGDDLKRGLILFLESTKHVTIQLQSAFKNKIKGFDAWWLEISKQLRGNTLCGFFYSLRNRVVKGGEDVMNISFEIKGPGALQGPLQINDEGVLTRHIKGDSYEWIPKKNIPGMKITEWYFSDYPGILNPFMLCEEYLGILEGIADDFILKFGRDR